MDELKKIDIKDFQSLSSAPDVCNILLVQQAGEPGKITIGLFKSMIKRDIIPSIKDGQWWIGELNTEVQAEGKTPVFRKGESGIEWKYNTEPEDQYRKLIDYSEIALTYDDLTPEQRADIISLDNMTAEEIALLQSPASDMIAVLEKTNSTVNDAERIRISNENERIEHENKRVDEENKRKAEYSGIITKLQQADQDSSEQTDLAKKATDDANAAAWNANQNADLAKEKAALADAAASGADASKDAALQAAEEAKEAKQASEEQIVLARKATGDANEAAENANQKAALANNAAQSANSAATEINDKIKAAIDALVAGAPGALDTLNELSAALGNDPNFATTVANELNKKLNKSDLPTSLPANGGHADTATNINNSGTVTLANAVESNAVTIRNRPLGTAVQTPTKLLDFNWYNDRWSIGIIRGSTTNSVGLGFYYKDVLKYQINSNDAKIFDYTRNTFLATIKDIPDITELMPKTGGTFTGQIQVPSLVVPYTGTSWYDMAKTVNTIACKIGQTEGLAHSLFRVTLFNGGRVVFGGTKNTVGFYGFTKATIDANTNKSDWNTTWDADGNLLHTGYLKAREFRVGPTDKGGVFDGNGDNVTFDVNNVKIQSWQGIGFWCSNDNKCRIVINTRTGDLTSLGNIAGAKIIKTGSNDTYVLLGGGGQAGYSIGSSPNNLVQRDANGCVNANKFIKTGSNDGNVLLGGGGEYPFTETEIANTIVRRNADGNIKANGFTITGGLVTQLLTANGEKIPYTNTNVGGGTIVQRNANGQIYASYFNSPNPIENTIANQISSIFVEANNDGFHRKISLNGFKTALGSLPASDVPAWSKQALPNPLDNNKVMDGNGNWTYPKILEVKDLRGTNTKPNGYADRKMTSFFWDQDHVTGNYYKSGLIFKGWENAHRVWQIYSGSGGVAETDIEQKQLFYRTGIGTTWEAPKKIAFTDMGYVMQEYIIDATTLDQNTYYPVVVTLNLIKKNRIEVHTVLSSSGIPTWCSHVNGFCTHFIEEVYGCGWGTNMIIERNIFSYQTSHIKFDGLNLNKYPIQNVTQLTNNSVEVIYVRGGGKYRFYTNNNLAPTLYTTRYEGVSGQYAEPKPIANLDNNIKVNIGGGSSSETTIYTLNTNGMLELEDNKVLLLNENDTKVLNKFIETDDTKNAIFVFGGNYQGGQNTIIPLTIEVDLGSDDKSIGVVRLDPISFDLYRFNITKDSSSGQWGARLGKRNRSSNTYFLTTQGLLDSNPIRGKVLNAHDCAVIKTLKALANIRDFDNSNICVFYNGEDIHYNNISTPVTVKFESNNNSFPYDFFVYLKDENGIDRKLTITILTDNYECQMTESDILYPVIDTRTIQYNNWHIDNSYYFVQFDFTNYFNTSYNKSDAIYKITMDLDITDAQSGAMMKIESVNMLSIGEATNINGFDTGGGTQTLDTIVYRIRLLYDDLDKKLIFQLGTVMDFRISEVVDIRDIRIRRII